MKKTSSTEIMYENEEYKIYPLGENALTIDFGNEISKTLNRIVTALAARIEANPSPGFIECVPAYSTLTVFFESVQTKRKFRSALTAFEITKNFVEIELHKLVEEIDKPPRLLKIPISFQNKHAPDLEFVAKSSGLGRGEVIEIFLSETYRVFMLGFLPGFAYMGEVDRRITTARKQTPRTRVPKGSVGIAEKQTGIYPLESPGGWQIIGHTNIKLFDREKEFPTLFQAGDLVKFVEE